MGRQFCLWALYISFERGLLVCLALICTRSLCRVSVVGGFVLLCRHNSNLLTLCLAMSLQWLALCVLYGRVSHFSLLRSHSALGKIPHTSWIPHRLLSYHSILVDHLTNQAQQLWSFTRTWTAGSHHVPRPLWITERKQELGWTIWVGLCIFKLILLKYS